MDEQARRLEDGWRMVDVALKDGFDGLRFPKVGALWEGRGCPSLSRQMGGVAGDERVGGGWKTVGEWLCGG